MRTIIEPTTMTTETTTHVFRAMGCQIEVQLVFDPRAITGDAVHLAFRATEARFRLQDAELSRFLDTSGLSRLNRAAGRGPQSVSPLLLTVTRCALDAAAATDEVFDPTLGTVLANLGYDRTFALVPQFADDAAPALLPLHRREALHEIIIDPDSCTVSLPADVALDFGGIGKGWAVDQAVAHLRCVPGSAGGLVNAGGDLRVWGDAPDGERAWRVGVEDPQALDRDCTVLAVRDAAVATSSTAYRRWKRGDRWIHHLLDPRTGQPAVTDVAAVTVTGPSAMWAEIHAKVALLHGMAAGLAYLEAHDGYDGLLIANDGSHARTTGMGGLRP